MKGTGYPAYCILTFLKNKQFQVVIIEIKFCGLGRKEKV